jgi:hypothetical protein
MSTKPCFSKAFAETARIEIAVPEDQLPFPISLYGVIRLFAQKADGTPDLRAPLDHYYTGGEFVPPRTLIIHLNSPRSGVAYVLPPPAGLRLER